MSEFFLFRLRSARHVESYASARRETFTLSTGIRVVVAAMLCAAGFVATPTASAQTALEDSVKEREQSEYEPNGVAIGALESFLIFPGLDATVLHTDNLYRESSNQTSDQIFLVKPQIAIRSDWDRHALNFTGSLTSATHREHSSEDWLDFQVGADGRLDILDSARAEAELSYRQGHEERGSPDISPQSEPTVYHVLGGKLSGDYSIDVILLQLELELEDYKFNDTAGCNPAIPSEIAQCRNADRNRLQYKIKARPSYELVPGSAAFVEASYNAHDYDREFDDLGFARSSNGYEVLLGGTLDVSGVTFIEASAGYRRQDFDDPRLAPIGGVSFRGRVIWNPSDLLTTTLFVRRLVKETTVAGASAAFTSLAGLEADYAMLENLILSAKGTYQLEAFEGLDREDTLFSLELGGRYMINNNFFTGAGYQYDVRGSGGGDAESNDEYTVNQVRVFVGVRF